MKKSSIIASIAAATMLLSMSAPAFAETVVNTSNTAVNITIEAGGPNVGEEPGDWEEGDIPTDPEGNILSVTVPAVLPLVFTKDGKTTVPENFTIRNFDTTDIDIKNIYLDPGETGWDIHQVASNAKPGEWLLDKGKNYKTIEMLVGDAADTSNDGAPTLVSIGKSTDDNRIAALGMTLEGVDEVDGSHNDITLKFQVCRTLFTEANDGPEDAYTMHIDFAFAED